MTEKSESKTLTVTEKFLLPIEDLEGLLIEYFKDQHALGSTDKVPSSVEIPYGPILRNSGWTDDDEEFDYLEFKLAKTYAE